MIQVEWKGKMAFQATMPDGTGFLMDTSAENGGENSGPSPVEALLSSIAGCAAMDVIEILRKKRQDVRSYRIEVTNERGPVGVYPRPLLKVKVVHILEGVDIDPVAVQRAIELSEEKYCSVMATLRANPKVTNEFRIEAPVAAT